MTDPIATAARWLSASHHLVCFTGAGISTDSGLPVFGVPEGVWTRRDAGLPPPRARVPSDQIRPNAGHLALVRLQDAGRLGFLISQNVDGLHLASGIHSGRLAELHGNSRQMKCLACDARFALEDVGWDRRRFGRGYRTQRAREGQPDCPTCGGRLISSVVNFGDPMPEREVELAWAHTQRCDVFLVIGSSLVVSPANDLPQVALSVGARLIILNRGETPYDDRAHLRISDGIGQALPAIVAGALG